VIDDTAAPLEQEPNLPRLHRAAIAYADAYKWPVLPLHSIVDGHCTCGQADCGSPAKHPHLGAGVSQATTDLFRVKLWWGREPAANIGIAPGVDAGFFVLDCDPRHGGDASLALLEQAHGSLPHTVVQNTGGGGRHFLFRFVAGFGNSVGTSDRGLMPGLDIRTTGSYIVAAPSLHASGQRYAWDPDHHPSRTAIAEAPSWLLARLRVMAPNASIPVALAGRRLGALLTKDCLTGHRNETLAHLANYLLWHRVNTNAVSILLSYWSEACCKPPLGQSEIADTVRSMARFRAKRGRRGDHGK
jgi:hypothetical protein